MNKFYTKIDLNIDISHFENIKKKAGIYNTADLEYEFVPIRGDILYKGLTKVRISEDELQSLPKLYNLIKYFSAVVALWKIPSNYFLDWHIDGGRNSCINIPIESVSDRFTVFQESIRDGDNDTVPSSGFVTRLDYELGYAFIMNTKMKHAVYNLRNTDSYILTISVVDPFEYVDIVDYYNSISQNEINK